MKLEIFFDGTCPICSREIAWIRRRTPATAVQFTDISDPAFDPNPLGKTVQQLATMIHGRSENGEWLTGIDLLARMYALAGLRRLERFLTAPLIRPLNQRAYTLFVRFRYRTPHQSCQDGHCRIDRKPD